MVIQFPGNNINYTNTLRETSREMMVSDDQYDRILQSVFSAVGEPDVVQYTTGNQVVEKMVSTNVSKVVNHVLATGTGAAVMAAALFLVVSVNTDTRGGGASIIIPDNEVPLSGGEMVQLPENGLPDYTVEMPLLPTDLPIAVPKLKGFHVEDDLICIYLEGVDVNTLWHSVYGMTPEGMRLTPVEIDILEKMIKFRLPSDRLEIYIEDNDGNRTQMEINPVL